MKAIVIGATGSTGKDLVKELIIDDRIEQIILFVRKEIEIDNPKISINVINFDKPEEWENLVHGDILFSCLGSTMKQAGGKEALWKIDYTYQYNFAKIAKKNGIKKYILVSASMANSKSIIFYSRMKGQLEDDVNRLNFPTTIIFNPPQLIRENSDRNTEVLGIKLIKILNSIGIFNSKKPISTKILAKAMLKGAFLYNTGTFYIKDNEISKLALK